MTATYQASNIQATQYFEASGFPAFHFTTYVQATNISYTVASGLVTSITVGFSCGAENVGGYTDITGGSTSYNIYSPYNAPTPTYNTTSSGGTATNIVVLGGTVRITGSAEQHSASNNAVSATASFDRSFNLTPLSLTTDCIFVDTNATTHPPTNILFLPILSGTAITNTKTLIIKDKANNAAGNNITIIPPVGTSIDNTPNNPITISSNSGCLTLFNDGVQYLIANNYPSNNQQILPQIQMPTSYQSGNAVINSINMFDTRTSSRGVGANIVVLPDSTGTVGLCVVVYYGDSSAGSRLSTNPLIFQAANGKLIDNVSPSTPYICVDSSERSCGAIFVTDGTGNWFVVGYYNSPGWDWTSTVSGGQVQLTASSFNDIKLTSQLANNFYSLPISPSVPYLLLIKTQSVQSSGSGVRYCSFIISEPSYQFFNEASKGIFYSGNQANNCIWFIANSGYTPTNPYVNYYPVIGYTP